MRYPGWIRKGEKGTLICFAKQHRKMEVDQETDAEEEKTIR